MADYIENMEHPMIAELRAQMGQQKSAYEQKVADQEEIAEDLRSDSNELSLILQGLIVMDDNDKIKPINASDVLEKISKVKFRTEVSDIRYYLKDIFANLKPVVETRTSTVARLVIPDSIKTMINKLSEEVNNY